MVGGEWNCGFAQCWVQLGRGCASQPRIKASGSGWWLVVTGDVLFLAAAHDTWASVRTSSAFISSPSVFCRLGSLKLEPHFEQDGDESTATSDSDLNNCD